MRELTLLENGFIAVLLLLSLLLPLLMSVRGPQESKMRRSCIKTIWIGQILGAAAAAVVLASAFLAPFAAAFGMVTYTCCGLLLLRRFQNCS